MTADWMERAACREIDPAIAWKVFFSSEEEKPYGYRQARSFCERCPVRFPCLDYAIANGIDHGMWGGTSEMERRKMKRRRKIA